MTAPTETGHFAARDGIQLQYRIHAAANARASVLIQHGFAEHGERYGHVVAALRPLGVSVMTLDARGHGHSGGRRVYVERFDEYESDLALAIELAAKKMAGPLFVLGHSMGGLIVLRHARSRPSAVAGWIVSNPALHNAVAIPAWKALLARCASGLAPALSVPSGIPPAHISRDADEVRRYEQDPLVSKVATARWYTEFVAAQAELLADPQRLRGLPVLALLGTGDRIIDSQATQQFLTHVGSDQVTVRTYQDCYHELFNELPTERAQVLADLGQWIAGHCPAS
jgi:alpha-beta hydrolase superfamily lysophospholipase